MLKLHCDLLVVAEVRGDVDLAERAAPQLSSELESSGNSDVHIALNIQYKKHVSLFYLKLILILYEYSFRYHLEKKVYTSAFAVVLFCFETSRIIFWIKSLYSINSPYCLLRIDF